ncbi:unnamed protein product [Mytilus edulis]|uniref:Uncharacterized protein n=1 Tax=Mytilus edulis TaxID=6550 RepID=A0A8S3U1M4_MYTED|nr:unnamed protein product [Mytilus edulis]
MCNTGFSKVDYAIASESLLSELKYFKTNDFKYLSDHVQITLYMNCSIISDTCMKKCLDEKRWHLIKSYKWTELSFSKLIYVLSTEDVKMEILDLEMQHFESNKLGVDSANEKLTKCLLTIAENTCKVISKPTKEKKKIKQPGFDHNFRDHHSNTRLMVACKVGNVDVVLFLLQYVVYPQSFAEDSILEDNSDNDSGVLDTDSVRTGSQEDRSDVTENRKVESSLHDISRPLGLVIYHDGFINHICAVNSMDGSTTLHTCLLKGDNFRIMELLLKIDPNDMTVNIQNSSGLTPLHLACQLERRKCTEILVNCPETDLNIPTLDGKLAEEMTNNKTIIKIVQRGRWGHPVR